MSNSKNNGSRSPSVSPSSPLGKEVRVSSQSPPDLAAASTRKMIRGSPGRHGMGPAEPTTREELYAWWAYFIAYEPISVVVFTLLMPLVMDEFTRLAGHLYGQPGVPCPAVLGKDQFCTIFHLGSFEVTNSAFTYTTIGISALIQALVFVSVGALADHGSFRRNLLMGSTILGSFFTICVVLVYDVQFWWLTAVLASLINVFAGVTLVFYNAYLPLLSQNHPEYLQAVEAETRALEDLDNEAMQQAHQADLMGSSPLSSASAESRAQAEHQRMLAAEAKVKVGERLSNWISTVGFISGYAAGLVLLLISATLLYFTKVTLAANMFNVRICIAGVGFWWLVIGTLAISRMRVRPGPPLPLDAGNYVAYSWGKVRKTLGKAQQLPNTFRYLVCYFFFSDAFNTMGVAAVIFCKTNIKGVEVSMIVVGVACSVVFAILGNFLLLTMQRRFAWSSKSVMIGMLLALAFLPVYGSAGLVTDLFGFKHAWEVIPMSIYYGTFVGAIQSFSRVLFADLIPEGEEAEFFSLYAITEKGSSWIGPIVVAIISSVADGRYGLLFLAFLLVLPLPMLIWYVDPVQGKRDCIDFTKSLFIEDAQEHPTESKQNNHMPSPGTSSEDVGQV